MKVKWNPPSHHHVRVITKHDFASLGEDVGGPFEQPQIKLEAANNWTVDVPKAVADYLVTYEPGFVKAAKDD